MSAAVVVRAVAAVLPGAAAAEPMAVPGVTSGSGAGVEVSAGGREMVFQSTAADIVPDDTNGRSDVFVRRFS
ncbi:hypothetical protein B6E66_01430 [Streptomyces maremycinicus]|nr:hypothetical protein B6E66_01430 [Streptomyces sp. B9173]